MNYVNIKMRTFGRDIYQLKEVNEKYLGHWLRKEVATIWRVNMSIYIFGGQNRQ